MTGSERNATMDATDGGVAREAVPEFVTVGNDHTAFLSGSVKGGGRYQLILPFIIPHIKQASSLATAVFAMLEFRFNVSLMYFLRSLSFALSAYATTSGVFPC